MMAEIFQLDKNHKLTDQKSSINSEEKKWGGENYTTHVTIKLLQASDKKKILKGFREGINTGYMQGN